MSITTSRVAAARAGLPLGDRGRVGVVVDRRPGAQPLAHPVAEVDVRERDVHRPDRDARRAGRSATGCRSRRATTRARRAAPDRRPSSPSRSASSRVDGRSDARRCAPIVPSRATTAGEDLRPADVDTDDAQLLHDGAATIRRRMPSPGGEKPYRVYRGGRVKGRCRPAEAREGTASATRRPGRHAAATAVPGRSRPLGRGRSAGPRATIALVLIVLVFSSGRVLGYLPFRERRLGGEQAAAAERAGRCSTPTRAALLSTPTDDPPARHRPRAARGARVGDRIATRSRSLRIDPTAPPDRTTSRSRATSRVEIPGLRRREDQRGVAGRRPARSRSRTVTTLHRPADQPRRRRRLRRVRGPDRQARRDRHHRRRSRSVSKFDCPYATRGALRPLAGLALRQGQAAHERPARADLLARAQERARPGRHGLHARRAQPAGAERGDGQAHELSTRS